MADIAYKRLTRPRNRALFSAAIATRSSLWLGPDHILHVDSTGYTENYKRFAFRDIQAVTVRYTQRWIIRIAAFVLLAVLFLAIGLGVGGVGALVGNGIVCGFFLLLLAVDLIKGQSCVCQLRTAVQTEDLPSLNRVRRVKRVMGVLRPLIVQAQGVIAPEQIPALVHELQMQARSSEATPEQAVPVPEPAAEAAADPNAPPPAAA